MLRTATACAGVYTPAIPECPDDCLGNGDCVNASCACLPGFVGLNCIPSPAKSDSDSDKALIIGLATGGGALLAMALMCCVVVFITCGASGAAVHHFAGDANVGQATTSPIYEGKEVGGQSPVYSIPSL